MTRRTHLRSLLEALTPADALEARHRQRMLALVDEATDPFGREHYLPGHFTASAFIVSAERDALLLILHEKLGLWLQPGGHIDPSDEDVIAAARREVQEEVGLSDLPLASSGIFDADIHLIPARGESPAHEHFDLRFVFEAKTRRAHPGSDARDARWVSLAELAASAHSQATVASERLALPTDESVLRAVRKLVRRGS